jgi:hypothetical protein
MGGFGSGRRGGRETTADYRRLDVRELHRAGVLIPGWRGGWCWYRRGQKRAEINIEVHELSVALRYSATSGGERKSYDYAVGLVRTSCNYGGARPWFLCPCCGRRAAILFGGAMFACRHCRRLAYESQRETAGDRAIRRADAIRERLGWQAGILNPDGWKPRGMHWRTFWRLKAEHDQLRSAGLEGMARQLGLIEARVDETARRLKAIRR